MREKAPRNERPQRRSAAPGSAGGVGVYWGEWSPTGDFLLPFPPGPFFLTTTGAAFRRDVPRLLQVQFLSPVRCLLWSGAGGFSGSPAESHSLPGPSKVAGSGELSFLLSVRTVSRKALLCCSLPLLLPRRRELGIAEPRQHLLGLIRTRCCSELAAPWAGLLTRLQVHDGGGSDNGGGCAPLSMARPSSGPGRTWAAAARGWRGWALSTCYCAGWPHGSGRAGRRRPRRALCAPGEAVLTLPAPPCCILIPGHCGRCTPSGKPLAGVVGENGRAQMWPVVPACGRDGK